VGEGEVFFEDTLFMTNSRSPDPFSLNYLSSTSVQSKYFVFICIIRTSRNFIMTPDESMKLTCKCIRFELRKEYLPFADTLNQTAFVRVGAPSDSLIKTLEGKYSYAFLIIVSRFNMSRKKVLLIT